MKKMADKLGGFSLRLSELGYTQICVARGTVSWGREDDTAEELQLWYHDGENKSFFYASQTAGVDTMWVCKVINVFTLHFQKCTDKIKTLLTKKSKFHFVQY